ncbi:MAG: DUF3822 family protein [Cyclobacteriaceae bacterium]
MDNTPTQEYKLVKRIKDDHFSVDDLHKYTLSLLIGIRDFSLAITDSHSQVLLLEDFRLEGVKTINTRITLLKEIFDNHHLLRAGFWKEVKLAFKTHKFTLVPAPMFVQSAAMDYLSVNSEIKTNIEDAHFYQHVMSDAVNIFAGDLKLVNWIKSVYVNRQIVFLHQGSSFIEGILRHDDHPHDKSMFCLIDRGILHTVVTEKQQLLYYNQFAAKKSEDYLRFIMLVFKELGLSQKSTKVVLWGNVSQKSKHMELIRKYIRDVSFGSRPAKLKFRYQFDEIPDHGYFDLLNIYMCA